MSAKKMYDWDGWFAQGSFKLRRGRQFNCRPSSIIQQARNAASERGLGLIVIESDQEIYFSVEGVHAAGKQ